MGVTENSQQPETDSRPRHPASITFHDTAQPNGRIEVYGGEAGLDLALRKLRRVSMSKRSEVMRRLFYTPPSAARKHKRLKHLAAERKRAAKRRADQ